MDNTLSPMAVPPHLSEATFRTYEPYISRAVEVWPGDTQFRPEEMIGTQNNLLSPATFAARMRDSFTSLRTFKWSTYINVEKLTKEMTGLFVVAYDKDGTVWVRSRNSRGRPPSGKPEGRAVGIQVDADLTRTPWTNITYDELVAVCTLIHGGRLIGPVLCVGEVPPTDRTKMETDFNVSVYFDPQLNQTIIQ